MLIIIYCDNKFVLHINANLVFHENTKYIKINCHVVRNKVLTSVVHVIPVTLKEQVVDIFTKSLHSSPFNNLQIKVGMIDIHSSLREC